ncbi:MAG: transporter [Candidatus Eisenbacteria bacterium]
MRARSATAALLILLATPVRAAEPMQTDRPDAAEGPGAVPMHSLQVEAGITLANFPDLTIGEILLRYGVASGVELRVAIPSWSSERTVGNGQLPDGWPRQQSSSLTGFGDVGLGGKFELPSPQPRLALGVLGGVTFPTGKSPFGGDRLSTDLILAAGLELFPIASLAVNVGAVREGATTGFVSAISLGLTHSPRWGSYLEWAFTNDGSERTQLFDGGLTFLVHPTLQIDLRAGVEGADSPRDLVLGFGLARRW